MQTTVVICVEFEPVSSCNDNRALVADPTHGGGVGDVGGGGGREGDRHRPKIKMLSP